MVLILIRWLPKIIAFGAVAAGSIKAQLAARVAGTIKLIGFKPVALAMEARIGRSISVEAILLVSSVKKAIPAVRVAMVMAGWTSARDLKCSQITAESPET